LQVFSTEWPTSILGRSRYYADENEFHVILESNTRIIFALQDDDTIKSGIMSKNILNQLITLRTYIANNPTKLTDSSVSYIDARIPGKLFVCGEKLLCQQNIALIYGDIVQ
jgi:hypothetical protein